MSIDSLNLIRELLENYIEEVKDQAGKDDVSNFEGKLRNKRHMDELVRAETALKEFNGKWHR